MSESYTVWRSPQITSPAQVHPLGSVFLVIAVAIACTYAAITKAFHRNFYLTKYVNVDLSDLGLW